MPRVEELDWPALVSVYGPRLRRAVCPIVGEAMAEDVVQEAFLRAFRNRASWDPERPIGPWLGTIARRAAVDAVRRERADERARATAAAVPHVADDPVGDAFFNSLRRAAIEDSFLHLRPRHRRLLGQDALDAVSRHALGEQEGLGAPALKSALARARRGFRERYLELARDSGVFGGVGIVHTTASRVRAWGPRAQATIGDGLMVVTAVCAIALAAVGGGGQSADGFSAAGMQPASAVGAVAAAAMLVPGSAAHLSVRPTANGTSVEVDGEMHVSPRAPGGEQPLGADVDWHVGSDGRNAGVSVVVTTHTPAGNQRLSAGMSVKNCEAGISASIQCQAWSAVPQEQRRNEIDATDVNAP